MSRLTVGSLFSGIGGFDLGLERAGMTVVWQVENEPYCNKVLAKHWPHVTRYGDIKEIDWSEVERPDLICGGFPCQPVSLAGKRLAQADERWLWPEVDRCIRALRPRYVLLENVPGLLSAGMSDVLGDLAALGFDAQWDCVPAGAFGAPYLRNRIFLLGFEPNSIHDRAFRISEGFQPAPIASRVYGEILRTARGADSYARWCQLPGGNWWRDQDESRICRVAYGVSNRSHRLRGLGNAVVPQVAEWIGRRIMAGDGL